MLIIYYTFSAQTSGLIHRLASGLSEQGVEVSEERLEPNRKLKFPIGTIPATLAMMLITFFRGRIPIKPLSEKCWQEYDLIILVGPTWSYNPSGPILSLLDRDGARLFAGQDVLPLISCRGYWRMHWWGLTNLLKRNQAKVVNRLVFSHPSKEPWRTVGVFLKLAGRMPRRDSFLGRRYPRYGHSKEQQEIAFAYGEKIGAALLEGASLTALDFSQTGQG